LSKLLLGSIAEQILRRAPCPVLTVGPRVAGLPTSTFGNGNSAPVEIRFQRILYATDFTPQSLAAKPLAVSLAREFGAELTLLHVIEEHADLSRKPGPLESATQRLEELVSEKEALSPKAVVEFGSPSGRILEVGEEHHADLIILGVRPPGYLGVVSHVPWATVPKVVAEACCPVLTVRG
jgi:nucleotide-binding universal stress UspA family protein